MLPAAHRLRKAAEFQDATRRGRRSGRGCVVVYLHDSGDRSVPKLGVITSRSVGNSVARHRAARRIRAAARPAVLALPPGSHVVIRALPGADRSADLARDVATALGSLVTAGSRP